MEGFSFDEAPCFDGNNFHYWSARMKIFLQSISFRLWHVVLHGFDQKHVLNDFDEKSFSFNIQAMPILRNALNVDAFAIIENCENSKDIWDTLHLHYATNDLVESVSVHRKEEKEQQEVAIERERTNSLDEKF